MKAVEVVGREGDEVDDGRDDGRYAFEEASRSETEADADAAEGRRLFVADPVFVFELPSRRGGSADASADVDAIVSRAPLGDVDVPIEVEEEEEER